MKLPHFYPILDTRVCQDQGMEPVEAASEILEGGARILQFRHKSLFTRQAFEWVQTIAGMAKYAGIPFVVNDRADVAKLFGAWLHVGQEDLPPKAVRSIIGPDAVLGYSTHNEAQLRAAANEPVDYLAIGPIFGTATKENPDPVVGLEELRRVRPNRCHGVPISCDRGDHAGECGRSARGRGGFGGGNRGSVRGRRSAGQGRGVDPGHGLKLRVLGTTL